MSGDPPATFEDAAARIAALKECHGLVRHAETLVERRIYVAKGPDGRLELFLEGTRESFGAWPRVEGVGWGEYDDLDNRRSVAALVVRTAASPIGQRVFAHIAFEAVSCLLLDPNAGSADLVRRLTPFLRMLSDAAMLGPSAQQGLFAELLFLGRLLDLARKSTPEIDGAVVLAAWTGSSPALRDFASARVAVEVKSSSAASRIHRISPMEQLVHSDDDVGRRLILCSVGLRRDASAAVTLLDLVNRTIDKLPSHLRARFVEMIGEYHRVGFDLGMAERYRMEAGFSTTHPMRLFEVGAGSVRLTPADFVLGRPPATVSRVAYDLDVSPWIPLDGSAELGVLQGLIAN